jgi:hypothetical protein
MTTHKYGVSNNGFDLSQASSLSDKSALSTEVTSNLGSQWELNILFPQMTNFS